MGLTAATVVGGVGGAIVMASVPDSSGVIHACYTTGLLARTRIIDSATQSCNANETAITWNQKGVKGDTGSGGSSGNTIKYAALTTDANLNIAQSEAQNNLVNLGGPQVTVNIPTTPGALVNLYLSSEVKLPCDLFGKITPVDETNGQEIDQNMAAGFTTANKNDFLPMAIGGATAGQWRSIEVTPGTHTYGVRYAVFPSDVNSSCDATFRNTKLRAEVLIPTN